MSSWEKNDDKPYKAYFLDTVPPEQPVGHFKAIPLKQWLRGYMATRLLKIAGHFEANTPYAPIYSNYHTIYLVL